MGVHGLWDLLAPVGRRVSVETLAGKRLAIDASIWMIQFMKAMRDEKGEMVRNAHLIGFFRRICKLLFLRTKPVFVFDGGTPALKHRTVIARRRQRENAQAKIRKTAEKLLMNHIKAMRLRNLAEDLKDQRAKNDKGKAVMLDKSNTSEKNDDVFKGHNQEMIDEMLVASILAEEYDGIDGSASASKGAIDSRNGNASTSASGAAFLTEDEDENDENDEEMILPISNGNVDPAVLAALPPSMQLDLLGQMRERLMAENRQKYQKVKKAPQKFSELQIEAYLKTVAFRREINEVQRAAAGKGVAGVQTSRIASEANREFIFSSSFSGDKQLLASGGADKDIARQQRTEKKDSSLDVLNAIASTTKSNPVAGTTTSERVGDFGNEVETFLDEKGRKHLSRRRAMGIRMTRDLQRNLELMREHEQETAANSLENGQATINEGKDKSHCKGHSLNAVDDFQGHTVQNSTENTLLEAEICKGVLAQRNQSCINISFDDDGEDRPLDGDDEIFSRLVAGNQVSISSADNSASDSEWEDGVICKESDGLNNDDKLAANSSHAQDGNSESDVDWEEGTCLIDDINNSEVKSYDVENSRKDENAVELQEEATDIRESVPEFATNSEVSKGSVEEEAALQEAIKRSLEDLTLRKTSNISPELEKSDYVYKSSLERESPSSEPSSKLGSVLYDKKRSLSFVAESDGSNVVAVKGEIPVTASPTCTTKESAQSGDMPKSCTSVQTHIGATDSLHVTFVNDITKSKEAASICNSHELSDSSTGRAASVLKERESRTDVKNNLAEEDIFLAALEEQGNDIKILSSREEDDIIELVGANLEDELLVLDQEYKNLGDEQRKLERNADSVNAEMFVECQELLQMFGLPYIIAPMEAEAQCAYMELANLVDGVVTDDSDVFLFGARSVYKNIFDDRKYVETYLMKDIESELGLNREKLIRMAMLLGSDYTEGVSGIGIVNAIEVVTAFPEEDGLRKFREWVESPDPTILGEISVQSGSSSKRRGSKASRGGKRNSKVDIPDGISSHENEDNQTIDDNERIKQAFMDKHRNVSKNWHIPGSFPSDAVVTAYTAPQVDKSTEPFAWGKPDIFILRKLCWEKFGWASQKADELLLPVLKEYNKHETQLRLEAFYTFNEKFAKIRSKRITQAVKGITGKRSLESARIDDLEEAPEKAKRRKASTRDKKSKNEEPLTKSNCCIVGDMSSSAKKSKSHQKRRVPKDGTSRGRGRRTAKTVQKDNSNSDVDETSIHIFSSSSDEHEHELHAEKVQVADSVRRSKRARKDVNYVDKDEEGDEQTDFPNKTSQTCSNNEAAGQNLSRCQDVPGDDVANPSREREMTPLGPSPGDGLAGDYFVNGGGFCANEDVPETENDQMCSVQNEETPFDKDYLQMGGGFCVNDEDEEDRNEDQEAGPGSEINRSESPISPESAPDTVQPSPKAEEGSPSDKKDTNMSNIAENAEDNNTPRFASAFSAIPYLKRKRRKN